MCLKRRLEAPRPHLLGYVLSISSISRLAPGSAVVYCTAWCALFAEIYALVTVCLDDRNVNMKMWRSIPQAHLLAAT